MFLKIKGLNIIIKCFDKWLKTIYFFFEIFEIKDFFKLVH